MESSTIAGVSSSYARNLPLIFLTQALYAAMFFMPTWVIYLQNNHGLSLTQVTLVDLAFWLTMALTEVPTGAVADTLGRKASLLIGVILSIVSVFIFGLAPNFALLMLANSLWGVALTFISGADMALFYDTLRELGRSKEYARLRGSLSAVTLGATAIGNILGGMLATLDLVYPFLAYGGVLVLCLLAMLGLKEPQREAHPESGHIPGFVETLHLAMAAIRLNPVLRGAILYANLLPLANVVITITLIQPHMISIGIPLVAFGVINFGFSLVRIGASANAGNLHKRLGERRFLALAPFLVVLGLVGLSALPGVWSLLALTLSLFAAVTARPAVEAIILSHAPGMARATMLSIDNLVFRILLALVEPGAGVVGDAYGLRIAFWMMAGVVALGLWLVTSGFLGRLGAEEVNPKKDELHEGHT